MTVLLFTSLCLSACIVTSFAEETNGHGKYYKDPSTTMLRATKGQRWKNLIFKNSRTLKKKKKNKGEDDDAVDTRELRDAVKLKNLLSHLGKFQHIADKSGGDRAVLTTGHEKTVAYVKKELEKAGGFDVYLQDFSYKLWALGKPDPVFYQDEKNPFTWIDGISGEDGYIPLENSGSATLENKKIQGVDLIVPLPSGAEPDTSTSGCEPEDFESFEEGNIALLQRGECAFTTKVENAIMAGAVAVIIFNEGQVNRSGAIYRSVSQDIPNIENVPVLFTSYNIGEQLALSQSPTYVTLIVNTLYEEFTSTNVIAKTKRGKEDSTITVSAHLESGFSSPGINDNGSGVSILLEVAKQMSKLKIEPENKIEFVFFSATFIGLFGSEYYIKTYLDEIDTTDRRIRLNLNFDILASHNGVRYVTLVNDDYPAGTAAAVKVMTDFCVKEGLPYEYEDTDLDIFATDYYYFFQNEIPGTYIYSGTLEIKTEEQSRVFGGTPNEMMDACWAEPCDTIDKINHDFLDQNADIVAHTVMTLALKEDLEKFLNRDSIIGNVAVQKSAMTSLSGHGTSLKHQRGGETMDL